MFTTEIKINGSMIIHIYGRNLGCNLDHQKYIKQLDTCTCDYTYELYQVEDRGLIKGKITHKRSDGIKSLLIKILKDSDKKGKAKNE